MKVGDNISRQVTFDAAGIEAFARTTGDMNPLHHDPVQAAKSRFGGIIASGSHTSALLLGTLAGWFKNEAENVGLDYAVRFKAAVHAGDVVTMTWRVVGIDFKPALNGDIVKAEGEAVRADGEVALKATAIAAIFHAGAATAR